MNANGEIKEFNLSNEFEAKEFEKFVALREEKFKNNERQEAVPITSDQARFFKTKGMAFRGLWGKRLTKGLTPDQALSLKAMIDEFVANEQK